MDPVIQQDGTARNISFSLVVANSSVEEARYNQQSVNLLLQMMYPRFEYGRRTAIGSYIEISGLSLLRDSSTLDSTTVFITNLTYDLNPEEGFITPGPGELYPILLTITVSAQALIPENVTQENYGENWQQPFPPTYPSYK